MQSKKTIIAAVTVAVLSTQCCSYHKHNKSALAMAILAWNRNTTLPQAIETARTMTGTRSISAAVILSDGTVINAVSNDPNGTNPVTEDTRFSIGSCTKTFIAACAFRLIEAGRLSLDDTLQKLLYDTGLIDAAYKNRINPQVRIKDLLNHTTGIDDYLGSSYYAAIYSDPALVWDHSKTLTHVDTPAYSFDSVNSGNNVFDYSNTNFILLGIIIEQVTGKKITAVITENCLAPLALENTYMAGVDPYWGLKSIPGRMAVGYEKNVLGQWVKSSTLISEDAVAVYSSTWTCGNMVSTARDMATWIKHYYQLQNGRGFLAGELLRQGTISSKYFSVKKFGYGIEYIRHRSGCELWGHTGTIIGFNSLVFYLPKKDISVAVLINDHRSDRWTILHCVLEYINAIQSTTM